MGYEIIDNFLSKEDHQKIYDSMIDGSFPWYFQTTVLNHHDRTKDFDHYQFNHLFYRKSNIESEWIGILTPILEKLNPHAILRIQANLNPKTDRNIHHDFHTDYDDSVTCKTCVYYVNTNNGPTVFEEGNIKVDAVANRLLRFDSNMSHGGTTCTDSQARIVININYV